MNTSLAKNTMAWRHVAMRVTVIYRILECGDKIPFDLTSKEGQRYSFIEKDLDAMYTDGFLEISEAEPEEAKSLWEKIKEKAKRKTSNVEVAIDDGPEIYWKVTKKGVNLKNSLVELYDHTLKLEIFANYGLNCCIDELEHVSEDGRVHDAAYDPRFEDVEERREENEVCDIRIAMSKFMSEKAHQSDSSKPISDPHIIVFLMNYLVSGELKRPDIWFDLKLGTFYEETEGLVQDAFSLYQLVPGVPELSKQMMESIYRLGMIEIRKREGTECDACQRPLAMYERNESGDYQKLTECPLDDCGVTFETPEDVDEYDCTSCGVQVHGEIHNCPGCGVTLNYNLPEGTIEIHNETIEEEFVLHEPVWNNYGVVTPCGWYDPEDCLSASILFSDSYCGFTSHVHYDDWVVYVDSVIIL